MTDRFHSGRERLSLDDAMNFAKARWTGEPHITYDPDLVPQYKIRRGSAHDGTMLFSVELMQQAMAPLFRRVSHYKPMGPPPPGMIPRYTVGRIKRYCVYVKRGNWWGERERVVIPVRCEYVPATSGPASSS